MKIFRHFNSLSSALLLHELSFILLIVTTLSVAISWSLYWQRSSEESLRLSMINTTMQNIRGQVYRQLKEVFDASFLHDTDAVHEYQHYTDSIQSSLTTLHQLARYAQEQNRISQIEHAYQTFYDETAIFLNQKDLNFMQRTELDKGLEQETFVKLEQAFSQLHQLISGQQQNIIASKDKWAARLLWLAPIPVLISLALIVIARRFVQQKVVRPLAQVMGGAKLISKGEFNHNIEESGVTELVRLARTINQMAAELAVHRDQLVEIKKQSALGELVPLVAHNIRNPLAGIRAAAQVARDDEISDNAKETLTDIIIAVDRLECWVTSLLSYLHPVKPALSSVRLTDIVDNALTMIELQLADKQIAVEKQGWEYATQTIELDAHLFEQAIFNLIQNALEASAAGDTITLIYQQQNGQIILRILDQGPGIGFDPVAETTAVAGAKKFSCGLGIPFAEKVIRQHQGSLRYIGREQGGTAVIISLVAT